MKFVVFINPTTDENTSQTVDVIETGSGCARTNKKKLRQYFIARGVPKKEVKGVMKKMGFWGERLGNQT